VYVTPNSETDMADAIEALLGNEPQRQRMSEYGKTRVRADLLWDKSILHLLHAYEHLFHGLRPKKAG